jgi:2-polyprenyl-6-hydroxyphenyl methylase / 3-demethylubiquinone-9 3-methyltransferase
MNNDNVDQEEIKKFDAIAENWWDPKGPMKPLHQLNPLRVQYINDKHKLTNKTILDVGCGGGLLAEAMAKLGGIVTGIDMSNDALNVAIQHAKDHDININYQHATIEQLASDKDQQFDIITCLEMLEHVPDYAAIVATCKRLLKPNGSIFFSTINRNTKAFMQAIVGAEYVLRLLPRGTHEYAKLIKPAELNQAAEDCGLKIQDITGINYNPFTQHFKLSKNVAVNYITHYKNHAE